MTRTRCQICGRRKHLRKDGTVVFHHTGGDPCPGRGFPPIEQDDARLVALTAEAWERHEKARAAIRELEGRRANYIPPELIARRNAAWLAAYALDKRAKRHREWPARYRRSIERQLAAHGYCWADEPPGYLVARAQEQAES